MWRAGPRASGPSRIVAGGGSPPIRGDRARAVIDATGQSGRPPPRPRIEFPSFSLFVEMPGAAPIVATARGWSERNG